MRFYFITTPNLSIGKDTADMISITGERSLTANLQALNQPGPIAERPSVRCPSCCVRDSRESLSLKLAIATTSPVFGWQSEKEV